MKVNSKKAKRLKLDVAAMMFPFAYSSKQRSLARLILTLSELVVPENLQIALQHLYPLFPSLYVRLSSSPYHYYLERLTEAPTVTQEKDGDLPLNMSEKEIKKCAIKVLYNGNKIIFEFFHAVSDGYGASVFLKALVAEYLRITYGLVLPLTSDIISPQQSNNHAIMTDRYLEIIGPKTKIKNLSPSFTFSGKAANLSITTLTYKTSKLINCARKYGVTLTALLAGVFNSAIHSVVGEEKIGEDEVRFSIPVNLRNLYNLDTMRNFSAPITLYSGKNHAEPFSARTASFDAQLKANVTREKLSALVTSYVKTATNKLLAIMPLGFKKWAVKTFFSLFKNGNTMTISNLGVFYLPQNMLPYVKDCSIILSPKPATPYSASVVSLGNALTLTITRGIENQGLETKVSDMIDELLLNSGKMETLR